MYRYNVPNAESSIVSQCEKDVADYTGHKYCVALNSCGSALMLMLKCTGLEHGDKVISNAFTFGAVPSAIEHAGGKVSNNFVHLIIYNCFRMGFHTTVLIRICHHKILRIYECTNV
jgi:hypothetical protein